MSLIQLFFYDIATFPLPYLDGYKFFVSANNVILCPGDEINGILPLKYFKMAVERKKGTYKK